MPGLIDDPHAAAEGNPTEGDPIDPALLRRELARILESRHFCQSRRARQFLAFVVEQKIRGNEDRIKERLIGIEVFGRDPDYATGEDPVVRVQAGEVRRRLELYQADAAGRSAVLIELPLGSYVPVFHLRPQAPAPSDLPATGDGQPSRPAADELRAQLPVTAEASPEDAGQGLWRPRFPLRLAAIGASLTLSAAGLWYGLGIVNRPAAWMDAFWGPATAARKPVLICMSKPAVYQPSATLFDRYAQDHPGAFQAPLERYVRVLPLDPDQTIRWGDLTVIANSGPAIGGVQAAMNISALFGRRNVPFGVRFGDEASFTELRESPAVIIGALNSRWMMSISANLHFFMKESQGRLTIQENGAGNRGWANQTIPAGRRDYGLVTRQVKGPTGQFTVKIEGISDGGTQAGSEIVSNPQALANAVRALPEGWEQKNVQLVVVTDIIEGKPGPPQLIAFYVW